MIKPIRYLLLLMPLLMGTITGTAQYKFEIKPAATEIGKEDVLQVEYKITGTTDAKNFVPPVFGKWKVIAGPSYSSQVISVNGKTESALSYVYTLKPLGVGEALLPATSAEVDGKKLSCSPVTIKVKNTAHVNGVSSPSNGLQLPGGFFQEDQLDEEEIEKASLLKPGESTDNKIKDNILVRVHASSTNCFIGEPILVTYELLTRIRSQSKIAKQPAFNGCTVYEMTTEDAEAGIVTYKGKKFKSYLIRKVQLFPLQTGDLKLDIATVDNDVTLYKANAAGYSPVNQTVSVSSEPLVIHVQPFPEPQKPIDFNGTIGRFKITTKADKLIDTAGDNNMLEITIEGSGNFQSINCPTVQWPANTEHFDFTERSDINKLLFPANGSRTFLIPFDAKHAGTVIIPPVQFSYLDIENHQYKTIQSDSVVISVAAALAKGYDTSKLSTDITNHKYIWLLPLIALIAGLIWWLMQGRNKDKDTKQASVLVKEEEQSKTANVNEVITYTQEQKPALSDRDQVMEICLLQQEREFFVRAKQYFEWKLQVQENQSNIATYEEMIRLCNEALYAPVQTENRLKVQAVLQERL